MRTLSMLVVVLAVGCGGGASSSEETTSSEEATSSEETTSGGDTTGPGDVVESLPGSGETERPLLTAEACAAQGGSVVGDIGDGATHRPDYVCPSGRAPLGDVASGVEGSVCCP